MEPKKNIQADLEKRKGMFLEVGLVVALSLILIGFEWAIQYITAVDGFLIMLLVFMPGVRKFYAKVP